MTRASLRLQQLRAVAFSAIAFALVSRAGAENFLLKDGRVITARSLRRDGNTIMATVEIAPAVEAKAAQNGQSAQEARPAQVGELGYPISQIATIEFAEPPQLRAAADLITQGRAAEALGQLSAPLKYYEGFRDAPGSWWADLSILKVEALLGQGHDNQADPIAAEIAKSATDPETVKLAKVLVAASVLRHGDFAKALETCQAIIKETKRPMTLAQAYITAGKCYLAEKNWDEALISFLEIPVFFPDERVLIPESMLGSGRAFAGLEDFTRAKETLNAVIATYGATIQAREAKAELPVIAKAEHIAELKK